MKNFKVGDTVYVYEFWSNSIVESVIKSIKDCDNDTFIEIDYKNFVDQNGMPISFLGGSAHAHISDVWPTVKEAYDAIIERSKQKIQSYCEEIKTVKDLIQFPVNHCFCGEEYTDNDALEAYKLRAFELLNVNIE